MAGGSSHRYKSQLPKQFENIHGQPLYLWALNTFLNWAPCGQVAIVVPTEWVAPVTESFSTLPLRHRVTVVEGGSTRQQSASNGVRALASSPSPWVMVHDAARPAMTSSLLDRLWEAANLEGGSYVGAVPGIEARETVKIVETGKPYDVVAGTLNRAKLRVIQTPQIIKKEILLKAYETFKDDNAVDDSCLVEKLGYQVVVVEGEQDNIKVTYPEDSRRVSDWLRDRYPQI